MAENFVGTPASPLPSEAPVPQLHSASFPKSRRLLRPREFRQVYDQGAKVPSSCFVAFCLSTGAPDGPKIGFTTPKALGKATARNRMRRRVRETFRRQLAGLGPNWRIVVNLRRAALDAPQSQIELDVQRVISRCKP
jgi:ribonuclease P protein component